MIRYNAKGEFNVPYGRYKQLNTAGVTLEHSQLLAHATLMNADYSEAFSACGSADFVFLDPPMTARFQITATVSIGMGLARRRMYVWLPIFVIYPARR